MKIDFIKHNSIRRRKIQLFLSDPLNLAWIFLAIMVVLILIFFDYIKTHFIRISLIGVFLSIFYILDAKVFKFINKNAEFYLYSNPFARKWKFFPIFLVEVYIAYFSALYLESLMHKFISINQLQRWHIFLWLGVMFGLYYYKEGRIKKTII